jgi:GDP-L-fucose synthase
MQTENKSKILITGGNGYISKSLFNNLKTKYQITLVTRDDFDLSDSRAVAEWFSNKKYDVVIHAAAVGGSRLLDEDNQIIDQNLQMYYNLLANKSCFNKFISFGSGAEVYAKSTPYGLSKHIIRKSILNKDNFYNLRIYAVFDENELDTRFIKANINRYIKKENIIIHQDKYMSFIYMQDLIKIVDYYITNDELEKEINCCYKNVYTLNEIADIINSLDSHKVDIIKHKVGLGLGYWGNDTFIPNLGYEGLKIGIKNVYKKLKTNK